MITEHIHCGSENDDFEQRRAFLRKTDIAKRIAAILFYAVFSCCMLFIVCVSFLKPLHYLVPWKMMMATAVFCALFLLFLAIWNKLPERFGTSKILPAVLAAFQIILIWTVTLLHGKHLGVGDYFIVYQSASELADGTPLTYYNYFCVYGNNTLPMILLSGLIKISRIIHLPETILLLFVSTAILALVFFALFVLTKEFSEKIRIPMLLFFAVWLPVYVFAGTFYTDTLSFGMGIISLAFLKTAVEKKKYYFILPAALSAAWGFCFKITSVIPLIAAVIVFVFFGIPGKVEKKDGKRIFVCMIVYLSLIGVLLLGIKGVSSGIDVYRDSKNKSNPLTAWIGMGMSGNGSYVDNVEFSDEMNALATKDEKSELAKAYIKDHIAEAFSFSHNVAKTQYNYASGMFSCYDYTYPDEFGSIMYKLLDPGGALFGRSCQFTFCLISIVYLSFLYGSIKAIVSLIKNRDKKVSEILSFPKVLADVSMFGTIVFLALWEANNRQLYNQLPILILALFTNAWDLIENVKNKRR